MEQLCINYANEKLHEQFTSSMFKFEQEEYTLEQVPWVQVAYEDNSGCIELFEANVGGLLSLINEEVRLPKGDEKALVLKMVASQKKSNFFRMLETVGSCFCFVCLSVCLFVCLVLFVEYLLCFH
jgi:myosin-5